MYTVAECWKGVCWELLSTLPVLAVTSPGHLLSFGLFLSYPHLVENRLLHLWNLAAGFRLCPFYFVVLFLRFAWFLNILSIVFLTAFHSDFRTSRLLLSINFMVLTAGPLSDGMPFLFFGVYVPLEFFSAQTPLVIYRFYRHNPFSSRGLFDRPLLANFSYFTFNKEFKDHLRRVFNVLTTVVENLYPTTWNPACLFQGSWFLSLMLRVVFLSFVRLFLLLVLLLFLPLTQVRS